MWSGQLKGRCENDEERYCVRGGGATDGTNSTAAALLPTEQCPGVAGDIQLSPCERSVDPSRGAISFDNMLISMLTIFQVRTLLV